MFGQVNLGEVVFISVYRVSIFLVQIRLVMEIMGVKSRAAQCRRSDFGAWRKCRARLCPPVTIETECKGVLREARRRIDMH